MLHKKGGGNKIRSDTMFDMNYQELKINVEQGRVVTTLNIIKH